ncbi:MAG: RnfABCDGE type electron transport complex subunit D, partial [Clostridia bacterium]|nr:RnfABCDGE type electron transport complex subunit D [Clostridia bacterium]
VYYIALAVLTSVLRHFTRMEVVSYVIMLMNLLVPLIDTYIVRKPFGYKKVKKQKEGK